MSGGDGINAVGAVGYGGTFTGGTNSADLHLAETRDPSSPQDGDLWTSGGQVKVRSNGQTIVLDTDVRMHPVCPACPAYLPASCVVPSLPWAYDARSGLFGSGASLTFVLLIAVVYRRWSRK